MASTRYSILVTNAQGATEGTVGTRAELTAWLRSWADPEALTAIVTDQHGRTVADKSVGRKTLDWIPACSIHHAPLVCPACLGAKRSEAKAAASRSNGKLGGRPPKTDAASK